MPMIMTGGGMMGAGRPIIALIMMVLELPAMPVVAGAAGALTDGGRRCGP